MSTLFLDRDGVIIYDDNYVVDIAKARLVPGIQSLLHSAKKCGYKIIVVSNQSAVARGKATIKEVENFHLQLNQALDGKIDHFYFCPWHPKVGGESFQKYSYMRKPHPGMILKAQREHEIDLNQSIFIGDRFSDIEAAYRAGVVAIQIIHSYSVIHPWAAETFDNLSDVEKTIIQSHPSYQAST